MVETASILEGGKVGNDHKNMCQKSKYKDSIWFSDEYFTKWPP